MKRRFRQWRIRRLRQALGLLAVRVHHMHLEPGMAEWDDAVRRHDELVAQLKLLESKP